MNAQTENASMDSILDATLDDLADMPEFIKYPAGAHQVVIEKIESKVINKAPYLEVKFKLRETLELAEPTDVAPVAGTESSVLFKMDNEFGQGSFKAVITPIAKHAGTASIRDAIAAAAGMEVVIVTKLKDNKDKTDKFMSIVSLTVV